MKYETLNLQPVYDSIKNSYQNMSSPPPLPERKEKEYVAYRKAYKRLLSGVGQGRAVYLWFAISSEKLYEYVYVGESHKNKGGLKRRLDDEFRRMYHGFWATVFKNENKYLSESLQIFVDSVKYNPKESYENGIKNDFDRRGASHIVYCAEIAEDVDILNIQNDIIQLCGNPRGNKKDIRLRPFPPHHLVSQSKQIFDEFKKRIDSALPYII